MKAFRKIVKVITDILIALVIICSLFITIITLTSNKDGIPNIMGYSPFSIQSNSMYPTFKKGDLIIDKQVDIESLKVGDVISFFDTIDGENVIKTHRIVDISTETGVYLFYTKGDNNELPDSTVITDVDIIGLYSGKKIPVVGTILDILKGKWFFLFGIIIPLAIIFIYELIGFVKKYMEYKLEETSE